jgi:hypothetical protein
MLLQEIGFPPARARRRAVFAYSAYLGQLQLLRSAPDVLPQRGRASAAYTDEVLAVLVDPGDQGRPVPGR